MEQAAGLVTVYRSMETDAKADCETILQLLVDEGLSPEMLDDTAPGVPEGVYEVLVPVAQAERAGEIIDDNPLPGDVEEVDDAHELDLETIYHSEASTMAEVEATGIKNVLDASGIDAIIVGDSVLPNFPFEVKVAREHVERARQVLAEAELCGPAGAAEAELQSERHVSGAVSKAD